MKRQQRILLLWFGSVLLLIAFAAVPFLYLQAQLTPEQHRLIFEWLGDSRYLLAVPVVGLLALVIFGSRWLLEQLWSPLGQLSESLQTALENPSGPPIHVTGAPALVTLGTLLNRQVERTAHLQAQVEAQIAEAKETLEREKNVLAALVEELREGVVVCNKEGLVLLYNRAARRLLSEEATTPLGLGRSIKEVMQTPLLDYTLSELQDRQSSGSANLTQPFSFWQGARMLRVQTLGILDPNRELSGFVFVCEDLSPRPESHPFSVFEQQQKEKRRTSIANVRASVEMILDYPDIPPEKQRVFLEAIHSNAVQLSELLEVTPSQSAEQLRQHCPLEPVPAQEWLSGFLRGHKGAPELVPHTEGSLADCGLRVNAYLFNRMLEFFFGQLQRVLEVATLRYDLQQQGRFVLLDFNWQGKELPANALRQLLEERVESSDGTPLTISEILQRHDAEVWFQGGADSSEHGLRFFLPAEFQLAPRDQAHLSLESRPVFYDFDLFNKTSLPPELKDVPLRELRYTVFDTETTGLNPSAGDEIISIGAYRIVNGKLLENETFQQLIDPQRAISDASIAVHGITPEQVAGQPLITEVLPRFQRFTEGSVLVAHNAAFDLRFLELKERASKVRFTQPVLDTLLLSAVAQPKQNLHSLDEIAQRFGIRVEDRHSAMGDAWVTAQVFLRLVPLLEEKGIQTLEQAQNAAKETYYAKLKY